jgi:CheY-like chemotaxis protein
MLAVSPEETHPSILVIEDDARIRSLILALLRGAGFETQSVSDGARGLDALTREPGMTPYCSTCS